jgi:alkylation response protein AidB-like acyl-CoA dehydrogenase
MPAHIPRLPASVKHVLLAGVRFAFGDDQEELRRSVRRVLEVHAGAPSAREAARGDAGIDAALWKRLGTDLGLAGLIVPEQHGGAGLGWIELIAVMEELGRQLACVPCLSTVCLGTSALLIAGDDAQQARWLPAIASGDLTATLAFVEAASPGPAGGLHTTARRDGEHVVLTGRKRHVVDGHSAGLVIVTARAAGNDGVDGVELYAIPAGTPGLERRRLPTMDQTRALAELVLDDVRVPDSARLGRGSAAALEQILALARIGLAAEQVGGAQRCLDMSVDYAKVRTQFGRPIGSFQAIQHTCADMFVLVESARSAAYHAGWVASQHAAGALPDPEDPSSDLLAAAAIAKAYCSDAFYRCAADTIQVHGGIGFTWEHDAHLYFKRAHASRELLGAPAQHREALASAIGLGPTRPVISTGDA